jgi:glycosyltransferase involved in cell wall biosynthesis
MENGFAASRPTVVLPSGGGVDTDVFFPGKPGAPVYEKWGVPESSLFVFNSRSFRPLYVRTEEFFQAVEQLQHAWPNAVFGCAGMAGNPIVESYRRKLPYPERMLLFPSIGQSEMAELFRMAHVSVSPAVNDGTPNTLLEAMACGAFPVAGDIEPVREWITNGVNGLLCDPLAPTSIAKAIDVALRDEALRVRAATHNVQQVRAVAGRASVMPAAEEFYLRVLKSLEVVSARHLGTSNRVPTFDPE